MVSAARHPFAMGPAYMHILGMTELPFVARGGDGSRIDSKFAGVFEIERCLGILTRCTRKLQRIGSSDSDGAVYASGDGDEMCIVVPAASRYAYLSWKLPGARVRLCGMVVMGEGSARLY